LKRPLGNGKKKGRFTVEKRRGGLDGKGKGLLSKKKEEMKGKIYCKLNTKDL
jgi:hypothetical protein